MARTQSLLFVVLLGLAYTASAAADEPQEVDLTQLHGESEVVSSTMRFAHSTGFSPARSLLMIAKQTIYGGTMGWCGKKLVGGTAVPVALGPKYISNSAVSPRSPNCGKCVCIQIVSNHESNPHPPAAAKKYYGKKFKGIVMDKCPECKDNHIDVLAANPYLPKTMPKDMAYTVGIWKVDWKFISCSAAC